MNSDGQPGVNPAFWKGRKVFLTGHTGFKGAWMSLWLERLGAQITGFALEPPTEPNLFTLAGIAPGLRDVRGDIRDLPRVQEALLEAEPEVVIHMAAQSLVRSSYEDPVGTYATNVMGTVNLLEALRQTPSVRAVVVVTSDKCYENREWERGYREDDAMGGFDPYSSSKGCAELAVSAYRRSYFSRDGVHLASARAGNVIGGGDWAQDRLLPDLLRAFADQRPAVIRNPLATRPWQHVLEPLHGYLVIAERLASGDAAAAAGWNFGPSASGVMPVSQVADAAARLWGSGARWELDTAAHPHEARALALDASKASDILGWVPQLSPQEAIAWTVRWVKGFVDGQPARELALKDIGDYERRIVSKGGL